MASTDYELEEAYQRGHQIGYDKGYDSGYGDAAEKITRQANRNTKTLIENLMAIVRMKGARKT